VTKDQLNVARTLDAAQHYFSLGMKLVPVPRQGNHKDPNKRGWQTRIYVAKDFFDDGQNIGVRLGEELGKDAYPADVDIDMKRADKITSFPGAAEVVAELLPECGWIHGRDSAPRTHLVYLTSAPVTSVKYVGLHGATLLELRGRSAKKQSPQITIVPPGVHHTCESIQFNVLDMATFANVKNADGIARGAMIAAVGLAVLQVWPQKGIRHDARLAFSKVLHTAGLSEIECKAILRAVNRATGSAVADVDACFADTISKPAEDTKGASWIIEHLDDGAATLKIIDRILGRTPSMPEGSFDVSQIDLKTLTPAVWQRVSESNKPAHCFLQGGVPVRSIRLPDNSKRRPTWTLQPLDSDRLRHHVVQSADFITQNGKGFKKAVPPRDLIADMLVTPPDRVPLPILTRITYAPTVADDGTIDLTSGYQHATSTFYVPDPSLTIPPVAVAPTTSDIDAARAALLEPLADFDFVTDADRTHAIALLLLPFVRNLIGGPTPLHLISKPVAGAGATLLTDTLLYPSVGTDIAKMSTVNDDDEWRKTITSTLLDGPTATVIDNARSLTSPVLAKVLTDTTWQARILGVSRNAMLKVECTWVATGINPELHQEVMRRIIPIRLDPKVERPWTRTSFSIPNLREWSRENRGRLIWAALTLARGWVLAGRPRGDGSLGMFEDWAAVVGGIVKFAGFPHFLSNLAAVYDEADVEGDAVHWFFENWHSNHGTTAITIADAARWALADGSPMLDLINSASERGRSTRFSLWVRQLKGRVVDLNGDLKIIEPFKETGATRSHTWKMRSVVSQSPIPF
jgi:hypothetical protein